MSVEILDTLMSARGEFRLRALRRGVEVFRWDGDNLVVSAARDVLARLAAGTGEMKAIKFVGFGTGGLTVSPDDVGLTDAHYVPVGAPAFPSPGVVSFPWVLPEDEANGMIIREFGLFAEDLTLFARKVRTQPIAKSDLELEGEWNLYF